MTSTFPNISISTERLVLRPLDEDDVAALTEMMNDEQVAAWTDVPQPFTEEGARTWITEYAPAERAAGRGLDLAVTEFLTQRLVGLVQLGRTDWHIRSTELSYIVAPWARGEGYASEAALATAQWLFGDQRFERIELRTAADNTASQQVAQKIGCISEGVLRNACIAHVRAEDGTWTDVRTDFIVWSLLPEDLEGAGGELADANGFTSFADWN
ncbi:MULTISPECIES: GNAT family N-acetyltransferase [Streptomyces]|uniref:GNAT family N-acetyltransferase n=1 Tax=Streptomyces TaxID=1883 RepID=UPI0002D8A3E9|nr:MULTISPECIES: GNAT family N-acetyltransferase [Streptomyces]MYS41816.1 GNAT family N-acetyltransferase [Streptomyces sp. SID5998]MYX43112.1 GNAT family N-acetyltransferase [Streptomyces sp. SID89]NED73529.1 GNAT family N-acetyltransferase [Streptomyces sp. SID9944]MBY8867330.1 GNAT family N-acetyltransferase [Streptomyces sennicomposti]NED35134.1 GNAT family N-acetyltransferase [Streptomyces sp. SID8499]